MIRKMDLAYIHGQTVDSMLDNGKMGNSMVKASIKMLIKLNVQAYGKKVNGWPGLTTMISKNKWKK